MITNEDLQMSKLGYTNKDFGTVYPQLLDLAKQLTNKWDPSLSNESDPGVVLLKEGAFVADHNNYNIDKNILEAFLPSATQESSVRNIMDMNGYNPRYYVSASGDLTFTYVADTTETFKPFRIEKFTMQVSNDDETVTYTQVSDLSIDEDQVPATCTFLEGTKTELTIDGSNVILLENLDENLRIYFPVDYVAQNGIFVVSQDSPNDYWKRVDYLLTQPLESKVYKVGYDNQKGVPYVQFPSDISTIIGNGLNINYITTLGTSGNVSAKQLTKLVSSTTYKYESREIDLSKLTISNYSSILNGKDPETIDEMYASFQKIVGTFDTLVTRKDYNNAINSSTNSVTGQKLLSNVIVTDINNDYNHACKIISYNEYGTYFETASLMSGITQFRFMPDYDSCSQLGDIYVDNGVFKYLAVLPKDQGSFQPITKIGYTEFMNKTVAMSPFDLYVYAMRAYNSSEYRDDKPQQALENSYIPTFHSSEPDKISTEIDTAIAGISEYKCINANYKFAESGDILFFKNLVPLYITITPYNKVSSEEKDSIIKSVHKAISTSFNASKLSFGNELNYDDVVSVLLKADDRIKNIRLESFTYNTKAVIKDGTEKGYHELDVYNADNIDLLIDLIAKNVLAGRLCLFDFDDEFLCEFGQILPGTASNLIINKVDTITSEAEIPLQANTKLQSSTNQNESIYIFTQSESEYIQITCTTEIKISSTTEWYEVKLPSIGNNVLTVGSNLQDGKPSITSQYIPSENKKIYVNCKEIKTISSQPTTVKRENFQVKVVAVDKNNTTADSQVKIDLQSDNEYIHIAYQNYTSDIVYPTYVNYRFTSTASDDSIPANVDYKLKDGQVLYLLYTTDGVQKVDTYTIGDVIKTNFKIGVTVSGTNKTWTDSYGGENTASFQTLGTNQQVDHRVKMETILDSANTPCYWIRNNTENNMFPQYSGAKYYDTILGAGEYFIYANQNKDTLVILGAGTKLTGYVDSQLVEKWKINEDISIKSIEEDGFNSGLTWRYLDFSKNNFIINEQQVITLGKGDSLTIDGGFVGGTVSKLSNDWVTTLDTTTISYTLADGTSTLLPGLQGGYQLRSRLDIVMGSDSGQTLSSNQTLKLVHNGQTTELTNCTVKSSEYISTYGDTSLDLKKLINTTVDMFTYSQSKCYYGADKKELLHANHKWSTTITGATTIYLPFLARSDRNYIVPIYIVLGSDTKGVAKKYTFTITVNKGTPDTPGETINICEYNVSSESTLFTIKDSGMYLIGISKVDSNTNAYMKIDVTIPSTDVNETTTDSNTIITVFDPKVYTGLNKNLQLKLSDTKTIKLSDVEKQMKKIVKSSSKSDVKPYYVNVPETSIAIQDDDLSNPNIFWDVNNVANHITIPQIDIPNSNIDIMKSMRNYT